MLTNLKTLDYKISKAIFFLPKNQKANSFIQILIIGTGVPIFFLALQVIYLEKHNFFFTAFIALVINYLLNEILIKNLVKRQRPSFLDKRHRTYSFPSTHSSGPIMFLLIIFIYFNLAPAVLIAGFIYCVLLGFLRIYFGYHYFTDVLLGFFIGIIEALLLLLLIQ